ncbi:putative tRNA pseudouridine(55) synthase [Seiridium cardinale]|uniref:tRNA pseudouridine(55) synthase n=1 Tax=Seiridium cardinale TaxID=138064 RepID=A0ABR2XVQ2_9PEZI
MAASKPVLDGLFAVNKPMGMSSAQVIRDCQQQFNPSTFFKPMIDEQKSSRGQESNTKKKRRGHGRNEIRVKMGHGGTLDPLATGVLILGTGRGTKSLQSFLDCTKTYETIVLFGASTDTYDRVGKILKKTAYDHITKPMVEEALNSFRGKLQQMPPLYSALKMEGKPLYEYAREGKPIPREIATREVQVTELEMVEYYEPGTHDHRWPAEDATQFEKSFAEQVWKIEKDQMTREKRTPEEEEEEKAALERYEQVKRKADERVDDLIYDKNNKRQKKAKSPPMMMSGALGQPPEKKGGKGSNLVPPPHDPNTPPPWDDKGPPAARIRMTVTSGFYVRSFCHDLGIKIGSSAMMAELSRSRQGDFVLGTENCIEYDDIIKGEDVWAPQVEAALRQWNAKSTPGVVQAPTRAERVESPKQKSIESPPYKRKVSEEPLTEEPAMKRKKSNSTSPKPTSTKKKSSEDVESKVKVEERDEEEEEWNGIPDDHALPKPEVAKA